MRGSGVIPGQDCGKLHRQLTLEQLSRNSRFQLLLGKGCLFLFKCLTIFCQVIPLSLLFVHTGEFFGFVRLLFGAFFPLGSGRGKRLADPAVKFTLEFLVFQQFVKCRSGVAPIGVGAGVARCPLCVGVCSCFAGFFGKQLDLQRQACAHLTALLIGAVLGILFCHC